MPASRRRALLPLCVLALALTCSVVAGAQADGSERSGASSTERLLDELARCRLRDDWIGAANILERLAARERDLVRRSHYQYTLGVIHRDHLHDVNRALAAFVSALQLAPSSMEALDAAHVLATQEGKWRELREAYLAALTANDMQDRTRALLLAKLGLLERDQLHMPEAAVAHFREVKALYPSHRLASGWIVTLEQQLRPPVETSVRSLQMLSPATSSWWVVALAVPLPLSILLAAWCWLTFRARARRAPPDPSKMTLSAGPVLLTGTVALDLEAPVIEVLIEQEGRESQNKNSWSHRWSETSRRTRERPFSLRLASGRVLRVLPDRHTRVLAALETERYDFITRQRVARIVPGNSVWVRGVLGQERDGATILCGDEARPLEVGSLPYLAQFSYWQGVYRRLLLRVGLPMLALQAALMFPSIALLYASEVTTATITHGRAHKERRSRQLHYHVYGIAPELGQLPIEAPVSAIDYAKLRAGDLRRVPLSYVPAYPALHAIGAPPTFSRADLVLLPVLQLLALMLVLVLARPRRPWYEQKRVREVGNGRLQDHVWQTQAPSSKGLYEERPTPASAPGPVDP